MQTKKMQKIISSILMFTFVMFNLLSMGNIKTAQADTITPVTIAAWNYIAAPASAIVPATSGVLLTEAVLTNFKAATPTYSTSSLSINGWDAGFVPGPPDQSKYWQISLSTLGYENITVASKFRSSGTGPRDFKVTYSIDNGITWNDFASNAYAITTTAAISFFVPDNLSLPANTANAANLSVRFIMTSNISSRAGTTIGTNSYSATETVASGGTSNINNIIVQGTSITGPPVNVPASGVTLDQSTLSLGVGQTATLVPTVAPSTATNKNVTWSSSDNNVATVANGVVTAVTAGIANITATTVDGGFVSPLCVITVSANAPPTNKIFNVIEITDFHGQLLDSTNIKPVGAALAKVIKDVKATNPDRTLIIGGGDLYQGTPVSNVLRGVPVQQVLSNMGMEVTTLGNHEFDWGLDVINTKTMFDANYEIVCANMYKIGTNDRPYAPYKIITKDGVRIAVIGAILKDAPTIIMPALVAPFDFRDPAIEINTCAKEIRDGNLADVVLADIHDGGSSLNTIVNNLHGVDAVFGGHTHTSYDAVNKDADLKDVPTLNASSTGKGFINLKITVDAVTKALSFSSSNWNALTVTTTSPTDPTCKKIVDDASAELLPIFNEVIGNDTVSYTSGQVDSPYGESQLGNWMADVVKNYTGSPAEVGMVNNGGIRLSPIPAGDITVGTIFSIMPFDNTICTTTMTGAQLRFIFEQAVQNGGKGIQISGVKFAYDSTKPSYKPAVVAADGTITTPEIPGQRVLSITRESDGTVVNDTDIIKVNAPDFVATGGDTFSGFLVPSIVSSLVDSHYTVRDALNADVRAKGKITVVMNNRVDNQMVVADPVIMSIAEARTTDKTAVILTGYVSAVNGKNVFMQDNMVSPTAGICVYNSGGTTFTAHKGDKITVTGNLSVYNGLLEVTPTSASGVVQISTGNVVTPKEVTVSQITNAIQGQLIKVKNVTFTSIDNAGSSMVQDSTGSVAVYAMPVVAGLAVGDIADVTAAVTCYGATIELAVDSAADVVKAGVTIPNTVTLGTDPTSSTVVQFGTNGLTAPTFTAADGSYDFKLVYNAVQSTALRTWYDTHKKPSGEAPTWYTYLLNTVPESATDTEVNAMFKMVKSGSTWTIQDGTQLAAGDTAGANLGMIIPNNFPIGIYTLKGSVDGTEVTVVVTVTTTAKITIVGTSDLHGAIFPLDYNTGLAANVGLAKVSTYVNGVRATNPNTMLIDNGDTIQGTPLVYYYNMIDQVTEYPMMKVMGAMGYDTWTLGNHEFNYGLTTLNRIIGDATKEKIAVLSANTYKSDGTNFVQPYIIKSFVVNGKTIKVAILGLTTKTIPSWEDPAHYADLHFNDLVLEAQKWVPIIKAAGADVIIASIHSGIKGASDTIPENQADLVAQQVSGIDAILAGHAHTGKTYSFTNPDGKVVPVVEPKNGDGIFSQIDLNIDADGNFVGVTAKNVDITKDTTIVADPAILAIAQPYQDKTLEYTNTVIGQSTALFEGAKQLVEPSSIMELVNKVQAAGAGTTLSIAAPLSPTAKVPQGDIKRQDIMGVYVYENFLFGLNMTGKQLKNWMEWSVRYYKQTASASDPIVKDPTLNIADYNLDQLYGATYDIDLTQPACTVDSAGRVISGNRIKNLKINNLLVYDTDVLKVAINNYRYNGGGGFMVAAGFVPGSQATTDATFYDSAKALGDDGQVRNMMFKYVQDNGTISPTNSNNWKISKTLVVDISVDVKAAVDAITVLPADIQLTNKGAVESARSLVVTAKTKGAVDADITNLGILVSAEAKIVNLEKALADKVAAQAAAQAAADRAAKAAADKVVADKAAADKAAADKVVADKAAADKAAADKVVADKAAADKAAADKAAADKAAADKAAADKAAVDKVAAAKKAAAKVTAAKKAAAAKVAATKKAAAIKQAKARIKTIKLVTVNLKKGLRIYSSASVKSKVISNVKFRTQLFSEGTTGKWYKVRYNGKAGFVEKASVK